jgi:hypothetical protein
MFNEVDVDGNKLSRRSYVPTAMPARGGPELEL